MELRVTLRITEVLKFVSIIFGGVRAPVNELVPEDYVVTNFLRARTFACLKSLSAAFAWIFFSTRCGERCGWQLSLF